MLDFTAFALLIQPQGSLLKLELMSLGVGRHVTFTILARSRYMLRETFAGRENPNFGFPF